MITCRFENGNQAGLRHVTVASIIVKDNKILLARRGTFNGKPMLEFGKWGLPGGYLDRDENLVEGAKREAKEELGVDIANLRLMHIIDNPNRPAEDRQNVAFNFIAEAIGEPEKASEESSEFRWFDLENLPPKEEIAFDFAQELELYKRYLKKKFPLPLVGKV